MRSGGVDLAFEAAVDEDDVGYGKRHAECPPYQAHRERVRTGDARGSSVMSRSGPVVAGSSVG